MSNRIRKTRPQTVCVRKHGRASVSASVTIEAALAVPVFFFALVCLIYLLELMAIGTAVRSGLQYAGKQAAKEAYAAPLLQPSSLEADVVESIGAYRLERSLIEGGSGGRYYACEHCGGKGGGPAYITDYGDRYHSSLSCSGLKRTVYAVPLSEVIGKGACSKCGH